MSYLKTKEEISKMRKAGKIAANAMAEVKKMVKPGVTPIEIDEVVESIFQREGAESAFTKVEDYKFSICSTPNDWVVHGIPDRTPLKEGDIVGIDLGCVVEGFNSDMAETFAVGEVSQEVEEFLTIGKKALENAINEARVGNRIGDISNKIQTIVEGKGYSVVKEFVGHGIGKELHEEPWVPGIGKKGSGQELKEGLVIAIEVIYNQGVAAVEMLPDGWTIATKDGENSGLFERTVAITTKGPVVLTSE
jgi:methionyl aminopeptidase